MDEIIVSLPDGRMSNTFEAYIAWKHKADKAEAANAELLEALQKIVNIGTGLLEAEGLSAKAIGEAYGAADRIASEAIRKHKGD